MDLILLLVANELLLASEWTGTGLIRAIFWEAYLLTNSKEDFACGVTMQEEMVTLTEGDHPDRIHRTVWRHRRCCTYFADREFRNSLNAPCIPQSIS